MATTTLPFEEYRRRLLSCWLGKAVGGTLGGPFEGNEGTLALTFYEPVPERMLPNDDLDLQVVWLEAIRRKGLPIERHTLTEAWQAHIELWPDEYGVACRNLSRGIYAPASGAFDNGFTAGMGAAIRSELWACLAPGDPDLAAALAAEDACVDHTGEGVAAACFLAALQSLAFVERDRDILLDRSSAYLSPDSRVARAIADARAWWRESGDYDAVRARLRRVHGTQNFTDVAPNLAFIVLGWLAGGDFGSRICAAVNCGADTDCTGATLGALLGILDPDGIGREWLEPIGRELVLSPGMVGMHAPPTLDAFGDAVAQVAVAVGEYYNAAVRLTDIPASVTPLFARRAHGDALLLGRESPGAWRERSALVAVDPVPVRVLYPDGFAFAPGEARTVVVRVGDPAGAHPADLSFTATVPAGWGIETDAVTGSGADVREATYRVTAPAGAQRSYSNPLDIACAANGLQWRVSAGLPLCVPWRVNGALVEARGSTLPLPAGEANLSAAFNLPYDFAVRFVTQAPRALAVRIDGGEWHRHPGTYHVPAIHRPGDTAFTARLGRGWHTLEITAADGEPGDLFVALADGDSWAYLRGVEWRVPD